MNIYVELTHRFNQGRLRAIISGGQAVVLHRVAVMSKDGDWILREDEETTGHVLSVLAAYDARYRFGAPLDVRWLAGGWSSHFQFTFGLIRVRVDLVTRPPRLEADALSQLWKTQERMVLPFVGLRELAELKKTNREKDYVVIGELARLMTDPDEQLLYSRSARDLTDLAERFPERVEALAQQRPLLKLIRKGIAELEAALDAERRHLIRANEKRLMRYMTAAERWAEAWPAVAKDISGKPLAEAHRIMVACAEGVLPFRLEGNQSCFVSEMNF